MMGGGRVLFDTSAYFLFEACGDSEIECFDRTIGGAFQVESDAAAAEDDAQSCSYESLYFTRERELDGDCHFCSADFVCFGEDQHQVDEELIDPVDSEEEDGVVDQHCGGCMATSKESNGCEDWTMSEQERGRLFWEKCLAS